jgi:lysozyme family protein
MNKNYDLALKSLLVSEGEWSNHPKDPGKETYRGVALRTLIQKKMDINMDGRIDRKDLEEFEKDPMKLRAFYFTQYWLPVKADVLPTGLDYLVFDASVNQGPRRAIKFLQRAIRTKADGVLGVKSMKALSQSHIPDVMEWYQVYRTLHWTSLTIFAFFGKGWLRRGYHSYRIALGIIGVDQALTMADPDGR